MKRHNWIHCLLTIGVLLVPSLVAAERFKWWQSPDIQRALRLSPKQIAELDDIFRTSLPERRALRAALDKCEEAFEQLLKEPDAAEHFAERLIDRLEQARVRRNVARTMLLLRMRRILTPTQRTALDKIAAQRRSRRSAGAPPAP